MSDLTIKQDVEMAIAQGLGHVPTHTDQDPGHCEMSPLKAHHRHSPSFLP